MSRRGRSPRDEGAGAGIAPVYEGPQVLGALLSRAGSPHDVREVARRFADAQRAGVDRASVIPGLFEGEPRFDSPDAARRLYGNLFGLWARLAAGLGAEDDAPAPVAPEDPAADERPSLPERGALPGAILTRELVEAVWKDLAAASPRELRRRRDRFSNVQPDLAAWLDATPLPDAAAVAAADLAFEAWAMFDHGFGERLQVVEFRDLRALEQEPPSPEEEQPALAAYAAEQLDLLGEEDPAFGAEQRAAVERALATVAAALTRGVRLPS